MMAVKQVELPKTESDRDDIRQKQVVDVLLSESETLKDLDHPNIVQYLGFEHSTDHLSIFLEYVPGGPIGDCLRKLGKFGREVVKSFTQQVVEGLEYLHNHGIMHCDLKADNIFLDPSGICKISDFGISKRNVLHNSMHGYNAKIDIWSLGCPVLEMWAGRRPWNQEDLVALGASRLAPIMPDDVVLDEIEDDFRRNCFAIDPADRLTVAELHKIKSWK
ncbi:hypothetical protein M422DRAFT_75003 [Sphaerobolus stellatus SS14]|uniref:Protein kinase domain-containing protein n=1 Tax=Sphaerobolus stellatus (strain SS14) TaxID=990650 RepID=A0A0C9VEV4_SPHS4|nr:hypothetical protein M422DRAFT_75003 [Sphaerobolus stellatus SS14]